VRRLIPARALPEWAALSRALHGITPVCMSAADAWFDGDPAEAEEACSHCPVVAPCNAYAAAAGEQHGVWGGANRAAARRYPAGRRAS